MTALGLIASIFSRAQPSIAPNTRCITQRQLEYLRVLIERDAEAVAARNRAPGELVWRPRGRWEYVIQEDVEGKRHTLTKTAAPAQAPSMSLFV